jgi:hypothetical protein
MDGVAAGVRLWSVFLAWGVTTSSLVGAYLLAASHGGAVWWILARALPTLGGASVGVVLCVRVPRNPISWLALALGVSQAVAYLGDAYSAAALKLPGAAAAAAAANVIEALPSFVLLPALLLLFPDGRLPSRRWRLPAMFAAAAATVGLIATLEASGSLNLNSSPPRANPLGVGGRTGSLMGYVGFACFLVLAVVAVAAAVSLVRRFRRATGDLREQLKWFGCGAALLALAAAAAVPLSSVSNVAATLLGVIAATFTVGAVGVSVLRYRLYEIDRLLSRTLSYALLTAMLVGVFGGIVTLATRVLPFSSPIAVAASTLAAAALFNPLRKRVQHLVDRRFNRARYDAEATVAAFSSHVRDAVDLDTVRDQLVLAVDRSLQPSHASLWLRPPNSPARS